MPRIIPVIDYRKIADAKDFYESRGYREIAVPWIVAHRAYKATRPSDRREFYTLDGYLNASGEQGIIELMLDGWKPDKHLCITPCFRDEPTYDDGLHHPYFFKLELIDGDATAENLSAMIGAAKEYFDRHFPTTPTRTVQTDECGQCFDIVDGTHGIELGSYGIREHAGLRWIYGTGIALPRLDTVLSKTPGHEPNV